MFPGIDHSMGSSLGASAFLCKAQMPSGDRHIEQMLGAAHNTLVANIEALMRHDKITSDAQLGKKAGIDQKTVWRIRKKEQSPTLDKLTSLARCFGLEVWQLLIPGLDPANPPVFVMSHTEQNLYNRLKRNLQDMVAAEPTQTYTAAAKVQEEYHGPERRHKRRREEDA